MKLLWPCRRSRQLASARTQTYDLKHNSCRELDASRHRGTGFAYGFHMVQSATVTGYRAGPRRGFLPKPPGLPDQTGRRLPLPGSPLPLAVGAVEGGPSPQAPVADGGTAGAAGLAFPAIDEILELEIARLPAGVHVVAQRAAALGDGF